MDLCGRTKEKLESVFEKADIKRAIRNFVCESLDAVARERQSFCRWTVSAEEAADTNWHNPLIAARISGFHVEISVQQEEGGQKLEKRYLLGEDWEAEKPVLKALAENLIERLQPVSQ